MAEFFQSRRFSYTLVMIISTDIEQTRIGVI